jgi:hypothetical protein
MNFQKYKNPYETLRIGERGLAVEICSIHIISVPPDEPQIIHLLLPNQMNKLMEGLQKGILDYNLLASCITSREEPQIVTTPVFYRGKGIIHPCSLALKNPEDADNYPIFLPKMIEKYYLVNGEFYKLSKSLMDLFPESCNFKKP